MKSRIPFLVMAGLLLVATGALGNEMHTGWWHGRKIVYKVINGRADLAG